MHDFTPNSALAGGALIGLASVWLLAANGRVGGGCTSGHGVCGLGRLSARSLVAGGMLHRLLARD